MKFILNMAVSIFVIFTAIPLKAQNTVYSYDALGRVTSVNESGGQSLANSTYDYDLAGNRRTVTIGTGAKATRNKSESVKIAKRVSSPKK